jgi:8-oxo-dGTP diphosphatase
VAIAIVAKDCDVLLVCRRGDDAGSISWQFPAGIVKPRTAPEETAVRETLAETGVHCAVRQNLGSRLHPVSKVHCDYCLCDYLGGTAESKDVVENVAVTWVPCGDVTRFIPQDVLYPPILAVLEDSMTQHPPEQEAAIAAAVIVDEGRVLLVRRRQKEGSLLWAFPSGRVEPSEAPAEAAAREVNEEVGLEVKPVKILGERVHPTTGRTMIYVACDIVAGQASVVAEDELAELAWASHSELATYVPNGFFPAVQEHLDSLLPHHPCENGTGTAGE